MTLVEKRLAVEFAEALRPDPDVLFDLPGRVGLAFDLSGISSGIYGAILVVVMLLRPQGLVPARPTVERKATLKAMARGPADRRRRWREA